MSYGLSTSLDDRRGDVPSLKPVILAFSVLSVLLLIVMKVIPAIGLSTLFLGIGAACFLLAGSTTGRDLLHPARVFGALWCSCLALGSMRLLPLISVWGWQTWFCLLIPLVTFPAGIWLGHWYFERRSRLQQLVSMGASAKAFLADHRGLIASVICLAIGMSVLAYEYYLIGGIPVLSANPDALRMKLFGVAGEVDDPQLNTLWIKLIHPFVEFNKYAMFLALLVLIQGVKRNRRAFTFGVAIILLGALAYGSQGGRGFLVQAAIVCIALVHYLRRRIRVREAAIAFAAMFLFVGLYGAFRIQKSESAPLFERAVGGSALPDGPLGEGIAFGYTTVTISFEVFNWLVDDLQSVQHPPHGFLLYSLHRFVPRSNIQEFAFGLYSGESITPTFLGEFYADYGYWGVLFGTLLLGFVYGWVYAKGEVQRSIYWIYVRATLLQMLIFFPYVNLFSQYLTWIFDLFFMYFLFRYAAAEKERLTRVGPNMHFEQRAQT